MKPNCYIYNTSEARWRIFFSFFRSWLLRSGINRVANLTVTTDKIPGTGQSTNILLLLGPLHNFFIFLGLLGLLSLWILVLELAASSDEVNRVGVGLDLAMSLQLNLGWKLVNEECGTFKYRRVVAQEHQKLGLGFIPHAVLSQLDGFGNLFLQRLDSWIWHFLRHFLFLFFFVFLMSKARFLVPNGP